MTRGHLVVRAPNWVGDLVMATPVLEAAVAGARDMGEPWSTVTVLVRGHLAGVLADGPVEPRTVAVKGSKEEVEAYARLQPDAALLLSNSLGAVWRARRVRQRMGAALSGRRPLLTHAVVPPSVDGRRLPIPTAHLLRDVAGLAGIHVPSLHPRLAVREALVSEERQRGRRLGLEPDEPFVLCCPGAAFGAAKLWPPERFSAALDGLHERYGWRAVVTGGPGEEPLVEAVVRGTRHESISLAGEPRDLERLKAWVRASRLVLVGDSGPRWYAAAFDVPCVSVMGPNFPELTASSLELAEVVRVEGLECAPCLERHCPLGHHRCMTELPVADVLAAAERVLARAAETVAAAVP